MTAQGRWTIQKMPLKALKPADYNPRESLGPGDPEYAALVTSLGRFGCVQPPVFNRRTGRLVGGHQRASALAALGVAETDVVVVDLPEVEEKALNLALNRVQGHWDEDKLALLLDELTRAPDFDVTVSGFSIPEVEDLLSQHGPANTGDLRPERFSVAGALATPGPTVTKPGDLIELGGHRLLCGDCTDPLQVRRLMTGAGAAGAPRVGRRGRGGGGGGGGGGAGKSERAVLFATDPPYCVGYDGTNHPGSKVGRRSSQNKDWSDSYGTTWDDAEPNFELYDRFIGAAVAEAIRPDAAWYCWHASRRQAMVEQAWEKHRAFVHCQVIWAKNRPVLTRTWYAWRHEPCFFGWMKPPKGSKPWRNRMEPVLGTLWNIDTIPNGPARPDHPTPKPLEVFEIPMRQHTRPGDICYEPFSGSGTQIIAAERLQRRCFAVEISPKYCDVAVRRFIAYAGRSAVSPEIAAQYEVRSPHGARARPPARSAAPSRGAAGADQGEPVGAAGARR